MNLDTNEIQTITTTVDDIDEVQIVTTSANPSSEVQAIVVSPIPGETSLTSMLSYTLRLNTLANGGSVEYSGVISATAVANGTDVSLREILGAMKNIPSPPNVTKSDTNSDGGHTYLVTFPASMKDVPQLEVHLSDLPVSTSTVQNANLLYGYFRLEYDNEETDPISSSADETEVQRALENLHSIGLVSVSRSPSDDQNGFSWTIQFLSDENAGNLDDLIVHADGLKTTSLAGGATAKVDVGGINGSHIDGNFTLSFSKYHNVCFQIFIECSSFLC